MAPQIFRTRRDNLRALIRQWGGPGSLAKKLGHTNASFLSQMAGPKPTRDVSERTARKIETQLDLPQGWLDSERDPFGKDKAEPVDISTERLSLCVALVTDICDKLSISPSPDKFADLVAIAYSERRNGSDLREYLTRLVKLMS